MRPWFVALLMAPSLASAQMSPTPPETRPQTVFSVPLDTLTPLPLPPPGETQPSLLFSTTPGAPPIAIMPPVTKPQAPESQPAPAMMMPPAADASPAEMPGAIPAMPGDFMQPIPAPPPVPAAPATETAPATPPAAETSPAKKAVVEMPEFLGIAQWINSAPLTKESLKGKVVLIDFWTYSCVNCLRTLPYLKDWQKKYKDKGLVIVGVHSPEFEFEKDPNNVAKAVQKLGIPYPVALDNQMATWAAYQNNVWPAHYFIDATGKIRHIHLGEGEYEESEKMIQKLLMEKDAPAPKPESQPAESQPATQPAESQPAPETKPAPSRRGKKGRRASAPAETQPPAEAKKPAPTPETKPAPMPALSKIEPNVDFSQIKSPETYLGLLRRERLVTSGRPIEMNEWMVDGKWRTEGDRIVLAEGTGKIYFRFNAVKVNLVLTATAGGVQAVVKIDGQIVPQAQAGADVKNGTLMITEPRMYELINLGGKGEEHVIEIEFLNPGAAAYAFTFG
ncbi:MAG TPA: redoxin family protein [bacterium]|nr:redoxin family protein [bacterium]